VVAVVVPAWLLAPPDVPEACLVVCVACFTVGVEVPLLEVEVGVVVGVVVEVGAGGGDESSARAGVT
jgi:hypothetical protein